MMLYIAACIEVAAQRECDAESYASSTGSVKEESAKGALTCRLLSLLLLTQHKNPQAAEVAAAPRTLLLRTIRKRLEWRDLRPHGNDTLQHWRLLGASAELFWSAISKPAAPHKPSVPSDQPLLEPAAPQAICGPLHRRDAAHPRSLAVATNESRRPIHMERARIIEEDLSLPKVGKTAASQCLHLLQARLAVAIVPRLESSKSRERLQPRMVAVQNHLYPRRTLSRKLAAAMRGLLVDVEIHLPRVQAKEAAVVARSQRVAKEAPRNPLPHLQMGSFPRSLAAPGQPKLLSSKLGAPNLAAMQSHFQLPQKRGAAAISPTLIPWKPNCLVARNKALAV